MDRKNDNGNLSSDHIVIHKRGALVVCVPVLVALITSVGGVVSDVIKAGNRTSADQIAILLQGPEIYRQRTSALEDDVRECRARIDLNERKIQVLKSQVREQAGRGSDCSSEVADL